MISEDENWIDFTSHFKSRRVNFSTMQILWQDSVLENICMVNGRWYGNNGYIRNGNGVPFIPSIQDILNSLYADYILLRGGIYVELKTSTKRN